MKKVNQRLLDALAALKPGNGGGGLPLLSVTGDIENQPFNFMVSDASHLAVLCTQQFAGLSKADELKVSVNFAPSQSMTTGGWWHGEGAVCGQLAAKAIQQGLPAFQGPGYSVVGTIEGKTFVFDGQNLGEINQQCLDFYHAQIGTKSDELTYFNGIENISETTGGWWQSSTEACNVIMAKLSQLK